MKRVFLLAAVLLVACASLPEKSYDLPKNLTASVAGSNALACRYNKQSNGQHQEPVSTWYFWRGPQRTESRDTLTNQGEIWERNQAGQLFYTRLFYNERVALEFVPGDLAATGSTMTWGQVSSLIDPSLLGKGLSLVGKDIENGNAIEYYLGTVNNVAIEVDWLPSLKLPARLAKKLPEGAVTLILSECSAQYGLDVKPISKTELMGFKRLDFTDLGDMENDPLVRHLEQLMGGHHHVGH